MVRKLSAKALIGFTPKDQLTDALYEIFEFIRENGRKSTNFQHGCLLTLSYGIKLMKSEYFMEFENHQNSLVSNIEDTNIAISCPYNGLILEELKSILDVLIKNQSEIEENNVITVDFKDDFHPGSRDLMLKCCGNSQKNVSNFDRCQQFINEEIIILQKPNNEHLKKIVDFIEENAIKQDYLTGKVG